jgi:hypothetical protein
MFELPSPSLFTISKVMKKFPVLVLSQHPIKIKISIRCVSVSHLSHFRKRFVKQITHTNEIDSNI